ncbi:hypothetical protein PAXRUDRAFT_835912 [Paxillus rubicundulus Ve08.2h10]|uniref:Uncharacterized protein n=1 Tax=Paxillus rubicundulus Ve08.2h10 TaxID=930991 RepID=A0A0D0CHL0_9AGAM|nr:hypothetical protein PAXRUDRAFT_835912 [Paxillus rubicundulus Ve08.2h10]
MSAREFVEAEQRIRTLTTILERMKWQSPPTSEHKAVPPFLQYLSTLLTCGDKHDRDAAKVVAVTGSFLPSGRVQTLVVAQNPFKSSPVSELSIQMARKADDPFWDVADVGLNVTSLQDHITDLWTALASYNPEARDAKDKFTSLALFVVARSFRKLRSRFLGDKRLFGGHRLFEKIEEWQPNRPELEPRWIVIPSWLDNLLAESPKIEKQELNLNGRTVVQWKLSDETKTEWAMILASMLRQLDGAIQKVMYARQKKTTQNILTEEERTAITELHTWCHYLYHFVHWKEGVVKILLTKTSLADTLSTSMQITTTGDETEELADLRREPNEAAGAQVLRYLRAVVAWHAALDKLCVMPFIKQVVEDLVIGVVEVPPCNTTILPREAISREHHRRFSGEAEDDTAIEGVLARYYPSEFTGTIHAEATLMGLLAYAHDNQRCNYGGEIQNVALLEQILAPANKAIAAGKKCCWCCARLATHLGRHLDTDFKLLGTHGILFAWSPPTVGVDVAVLRNLETDLWTELHNALSEAVPLTLSRQSSASSADAVNPDTLLPAKMPMWSQSKHTL